MANRFFRLNKTGFRLPAARKKNLLLINPWIYDFAAFDLWLKPVGLLSIGSLLRQFGYHVELIDCLDRHHPAFKKWETGRRTKSRKYGTGKFYREVIDKPKIFQHIPRNFSRYGLPFPLFEQDLHRHPKPDAVLVTSGMTYWYPGVFQVIESVKNIWPEVPVILGGIYATLCFKHAQQYSKADFVIQGAGEFALLKLLGDLLNHPVDLSQFPKRLDDFPYPAYDLYAKLEAVPVLTSRGCPYRCPFCASHLLEPTFRQRDPFRVVDEIEYYIKSFQVSNIAFWDDALLVNARQHFSKILSTIRARKVDAIFHLPNGIHPRLLSRELANQFAECNVKTIRLSFESAEPQRQKIMGNKVSNQDLAQAIFYLENAGYAAGELDVYLMMGLPGQSLSEVKKSMDYVNSLGARIRLSSFSPIPGTEDWEKAVHLSNFPADCDPLLTNNSVFPLHYSSAEFAQYDQIKKFARKFNATLGEKPIYG
ncbi:MAG: B12-binding domain-containing radical SAM protein [Methanosarcinaceae archaeon]